MSGFFYNKLKDLCISLGKHNDALYAVLAIAMFKGVMRPTFTMMDQKTDHQSKKYAAFREGLTEAIAFGSYLLTHRLIQFAVVPLARAYNKVNKNQEKSISLKKLQNGLSLLSVCLTAGIIIPVVCNLTLKPIMDGVAGFNNKKGKKNNTKLDIKENASPLTQMQMYSPKLSENSKRLLNTVRVTSMQNYGMKVGG